MIRDPKDFHHDISLRTFDDVADDSVLFCDVNRLEAWSKLAGAPTIEPSDSALLPFIGPALRCMQIARRLSDAELCERASLDEEMWGKIRTGRDVPLEEFTKAFIAITGGIWLPLREARVVHHLQRRYAEALSGQDDSGVCPQISRMTLEAWDNDVRAYVPAGTLSLLLTMERTEAAGVYRCIKDVAFEYDPAYAGPALDPWLPLEARETPFLYPFSEGELTTNWVPERATRGNYRAPWPDCRHLPPTLFEFAMGQGALQASSFFYFDQLNGFERWFVAGGARRGALRLLPVPGGYLDGMFPADIVSRWDPAEYHYEAFLAQQPTSVEAVAAYEYHRRIVDFAGYAGEGAKIPAQFDGQAWVIKLEQGLAHDLRLNAMVSRQEYAHLEMARAAGLSVMDARLIPMPKGKVGLALQDLSVDGPLPASPPGVVVEPPRKNRVLSLFEILRPLTANPEYPSDSGYDFTWQEAAEEMVHWVAEPKKALAEMARRYLMVHFLGDREVDMTDMMLVSPAGECRWELGPWSRLRNSGLFGHPRMRGLYAGGEGYLGEDMGFYEHAAWTFSLPGLPLTAQEVREWAQPLLAVVANWQEFYTDAGIDVTHAEYQHTRFPGLRPPEGATPSVPGSTEGWNLDWDDDAPSP